MNCTVRSASTGNALSDAHSFSFASVAALYEGLDPARLETYRMRAQLLTDSHSVAHRAALVAGLRPYLQQHGASEASLQALERLAAPDALAVVTGQQAGLFTGPLYAVHKALTAIGVARRLEQFLSRPVVPVFWIASEDHDWHEVNHAWLLDAEDRPARVALNLQPPHHQMVGRTPLPAAEIRRVLGEAWRIVPDGVGKRDAFDLLETAAVPDGSLADWFAGLMLRWFAEDGLVVLDPCLPEVRALVRPVWTHALAHVDEVQAALEEAYQAVEAAGHAPQVVRDPLHTTVFYVQDGRRYVLERAGEGRLRARGLGLEAPVREWIARAEAEPAAFSSNVLLRPVVQDTLLPTLAYVGGPAEIAYHALARGVFRAHGRTLVPLIHRQRMVLYPPHLQRLLKQHDLTPEALERPVDWEQRLAAEAGGDVLAQEFAEYRQSAIRRWEAWAAAHADLGPQVMAMARRHAETEAASLLRLERKVRRLLLQRQAARLAQLQRIDGWLWTGGQAQERRLSPVSVCSACGMSWLREAPRWGDVEHPAPIFHLML
ncbi:MAG: bacillithiol biosynthesis cysteine-adding enzyme BshC [Thermoflavifilum sp.]|nr:bacillithiol biosynthesis cysteine-adding enzyme BshC [Thermoflavifilum sp.]MCL6513258.1 bacillithiol biosynthesis cysteine-adding enzyme BshC [Alicyclobacillus sp.]